MRVVFLEAPEELLAERRHRAIDKKDEVWDGVLHVVPQPSGLHETRQAHLMIALAAIARRRGLETRGATTALLDPIAGEKNYRVPDVSVARPDHLSEHGLSGAELVVEILSPNDESRDKFPFYAKLGVRETWIVTPKSWETEVYTLRDEAYARAPARDGVTRSPVLGIDLEVRPGPTLRLRDGDEVVEI